MRVERMRSEISKVYSGEGWKTKVKRMPYLQVIAVYHSFLKDDRFRKQEIQPKNCDDMTCGRSYNDKGETVSDSFS